MKKMIIYFSLINLVHILVFFMVNHDYAYVYDISSDVSSNIFFLFGLIKKTS